MYKLFTDKSELFECDIKLEGASLSKSKARLVVETSDYSLLFKGSINSSGKCEIPIRKLKGLIDENTTGNIRLEVIAEDTYFTPWESDFEVDASKKVTVEVKSQSTKKPIVETKVRVKVKNEKPTITEKDHVINLFKLLIKEDINVDNISFKRNELNNIVATYLQENTVKNTNKVINGVLRVLEKKK
jgi:CRISPR/Cas system-associated exonuclease Cas4 (RecB family)